jgi:hypothetical protein
LPLATPPPWKLCCRIAGWPPILSIGWSSGKKNPAKLKPDAAENGLHVGSSSLNR